MFFCSTYEDMSQVSTLFKNIVRIVVQQKCPEAPRGRPRQIPFDVAFNQICRVLRSSMPWGLDQYVCGFHYQTVYKTWARWVSLNVFKIAYSRLLRLYSRRRHAKHYCIDTSYVKNRLGVDCLGRNPTDRGRMATKISMCVDDVGIPVCILAVPGNTSDQHLVEPTLDASGRRQTWVCCVLVQCCMRTKALILHETVEYVN